MIFQMNIGKMTKKYMDSIFYVFLCTTNILKTIETNIVFSKKINIVVKFYSQHLYSYQILIHKKRLAFTLQYLCFYLLISMLLPSNIYAFTSQYLCFYLLIS